MLTAASRQLRPFLISTSALHIMKEAGRPGVQRNIASFFKPAGSKPQLPASLPSGSDGLAKQNNLESGVVKVEPRHTRLKRTLEDSPEKRKEDTLLDDDIPAVQQQPVTVVSAREVPSQDAPLPSADGASASQPQATSSAAADSSKLAPAPKAQAAPKTTKAKAAPKVKAASKAAGKAASRSATAEQGEDSDAISFSEDISASESGGLSDAGEAPQSGTKRLKKFDDSTPTVKRKKTTKNGTSNVEGVGSGALEAALRACDTDITELTKGWVAGAPVPYAFLADTFEAIAETSKRLEITTMLINCFRAILSFSPDDLLPAVYMCTNRVAPSHQGLELGVGDSILLKSLAESSGRSEAALKKDYGAVGDLGKLAVSAKGTQRMLHPPPPLTIRGVFKAFKGIANTSGNKSVDVKRAMVCKLLAASKGNEAGYIMRSLQAKLRIGLAEQSVLTSLAHAVLLHQEGIGRGKKDGGIELAGQLERATQAVKTAYSECPSYEVMVPAMLAHGLWELPTHCHFMPSVPIKPMLAKPTTGVGEVLDKFSGIEFTCEYKYDGERAQIHVTEDGQVMVFSRNSENMTGKYPDIAARIPKLLGPGVKSLVIDAEAVAWDPKEKKILPFQVLSTRARKDVVVANIKVQVLVFAFDCLYLNGKSLLTAPLTERRAALYSAIQEKEGELQYAIAKTSKDTEELEQFLAEAVDAATEGLIVKTLNDTYEPSKRSSHWLKLKKDYMEGVGDTFDVVPIGGFHGKGKRAGVFGAYLLAIYDPSTETYQTISKLGTGFKEEQLMELADSLRPHIIPGPRNYYSWGETLVPDVWFEPVKVWEVKAADLSISPVHRAAAGLVDSTKGISIRFPRLVRVRDDKNPEDATTSEQVAEMYNDQAVVKRNKKPEAEEASE